VHNKTIDLSGVSAPQVNFEDVARFADATDNVAIACRRLEAGTKIAHKDSNYLLSHTVMEGHRFAATEIITDEPLLSWGLPFGTAIRGIGPGQCLASDRMLSVLSSRRLDFALPDSPNFSDREHHFELDPSRVEVGEQVAPHRSQAFFEGYDRGGSRGVGTRNYVVILAASSIVNGFVRSLSDTFQGAADDLRNVDGVVRVTHTEGDEDDLNNLDLVLRALSGYIVHPNVGAILVVDYGNESVRHDRLREFMASGGYPLDKVNHSFMSLSESGGFGKAKEHGRSLIASLLSAADRTERTRQSVEHLRLALQCGGSDAFSGISGNPLAGWMAREVLRYGGSANLAETTELIGAEDYLLRNVRDLEVVEDFRRAVERYKARAAIHGHDAEGNTSGGNYFRGLYNIAIKSIGAARKKSPDVRLDRVIDYGERVAESGFYFMDSPGNDLESIAGQVAWGANLILFSTGNGSITNFPFVPTIKIVTTTSRYELIKNEMDINAGRFQDGMPMDSLGNEAFKLALKVASGQQSAGERAGHSQVQIWRNWRQATPGNDVKIRQQPKPSGEPLKIRSRPMSERRFEAYRAGQGFSTDQVGAVIPTSLCSGQIARLIVNSLNDNLSGNAGVSRFVTFPHTEGCGVSSGDNEDLYLRILLGHATHPMVRRALFLEHGCEKTHNDAMRKTLCTQHADESEFGWASVQLDGGIEKATRKVVEWFERSSEDPPIFSREPVDLSHLRIGLLAVDNVPDLIAQSLADVTGEIAASGGTVAVSGNSNLWDSESFHGGLIDTQSAPSTLACGEKARLRGLHRMDMPTGQPMEATTALAASGAEVLLAFVNRHPLQAHPMVPLLQIGDAALPCQDLLIDTSEATEAVSKWLMDLVIRTASGSYTPIGLAQGYTDFQVTRGLLGISM
jgi:altronate dehydratase